MKELAQWAGFRFYIDAGSALLFEKLKISAEMETEEQEELGQKYVTGKSGKPVEVSLNVILNAKLGIDVQTVCMDFLEAAKTGKSGAFYMAGKRLLPFEIMMTKASTEEIMTAPGGRWVSANVSVTFRQSENGTILGGVIQTNTGAGDFTYSADPKKDLIHGAVASLYLPAANNQNWLFGSAGSKGNGASNATTGQDVMKTISNAKTVSSGVTQSKATSSPAQSSAAKTVKVSSGVISKLKKK